MLWVFFQMESWKIFVVLSRTLIHRIRALYSHTCTKISRNCTTSNWKNVSFKFTSSFIICQMLSYNKLKTQILVQVLKSRILIWFSIYMRTKAFNVISKTDYADPPCIMDYLLEGAQLLCFLAQQKSKHNSIQSYVTWLMLN